MEIWRKGGLAVLTLGWMVLAVSFWDLRDSQPYLPYLWPIWFAVTGVLNLVFALRPRYYMLYRIVGTMSVVGIASRVGSVFLALLAGDMAPGLAGIAITIYTMAATGVAYFWLTAVGPWSEAKALTGRSLSK